VDGAVSISALAGEVAMLDAKAVRLAAFVLAAALLAAGCTTQASNSEFFGKIDPPQGQVMRYITGSEPESLDPQMSSGQPEARIDMALYDGLAEYHPKTMEPIPSIAERWVTNEDASEFVFYLRHDAKFSDGSPIKAQDFVYTIRRGFGPELASRLAYLGYDIKYAEAFNSAQSFVRDPATGRFLLASEAAPAEAKGDNAAPPPPATQAGGDEEYRKRLAMKGEDAAPDTDFHRFIHSPGRLTVPSDEKGRQKAFKANPKLEALVAGKEFVPVKAEDIGVEAVDDYTLRITMRQPTPYFLGLVPHQFFRVIPQKVVEKYGVNWTKPENWVGSGPFKLKEHKPYNQLVVVRNPYFWDAANVHLDTLIFYPVEDNTTIMNLYKAGEVDATFNHTVPAAWLKSGVRYKKDYMDAPENAAAYWQINTTKPPLDDKRVRKALNMAIDRDALADYRVVSKANNTFVPQGILHGYPLIQGFQLDVAGAKRLMVEAGYKDAAGNYDPKKFPANQIEVTYNTNESNRQIAEFIQAQWKQNLGITIPLHNMEFKSFMEMRSKLQFKGMAGGAGWVGDYMDPYTYLGLFTTDGGDNGTGWFDPKFVQMLNDANREPDQSKRYEMLAKAESYLLDAAPVIPLLKPATSWMKKPYVKGMYPNPGTLHAWKYVYIEHDQAKWDKQMPDMTTDELAQADSKE
jgi:oligopeptide transport system substrate-binding protein